MFDSDTGSATGSFYQQSNNQYSGTLTNTMTWSVDNGAKMITYRFTWAALTNSSFDYSKAVTQQAHTFQFSIVGATLKFQGVDYIKK